jgi:Glycosyl transferase family 2
MRLVLALKTHDDEETVDACLSFHLNAGVDHVVASDGGSADGTLDVLDSYAREGLLDLSRKGESRTAMARRAAERLGADWVLHADGDEFLWPRGADLREVLAAIPRRYAAVRALTRTFPERPGEGLFSERRVSRLTARDELDDARSSGRAVLRVAHRPIPNVAIAPDGGGVAGSAIRLRGWYPIEALRFPGRGQTGREPTPGRAPILDTRLRDVLRELARPGTSGPRRFALSGELSQLLRLPLPSVVDEASYALDVAVVGEADVAGVQQRLDRLEGEVEQLARRFWIRVGRKLEGLAQRQRA